MEFEYMSNPHVDLLYEPSVALSNHSLCSIVLAYHHNQKKTFLSLDQAHSTGQVILMYPWKYQSEANGCDHHLVKYMEYENGTPALCWFNYAGLTADEMDWNEVEEHPILKSKTELNAITMMEFDWLDCLDLTQNDAVDQPAIDTEDLSIASFDAGHKPSGKVADDNDFLPQLKHSLLVWSIQILLSPQPPM